jgi:hypothetical protein
VDRLTKIVVTAWACAVLACEVWLVSSSWSSLPLLSLLAAACFFALSSYDQRAVGIVLAAAYVYPAAVWILHGGAPYAPYAALWVAALMGAMLPQILRTGWHIPTTWRPVLVAAALVIVATSPIVALREIDMNVGLLADRIGWSHAGTLWPSLAVTWTFHVSLTLVVGLLWFDWLFGARGLDFQATVVLPLVGSALVLSTVTAYQLFVDVHFLNPTVYAFIGRASGPMFDANVSGTLAALWMAGTYAWARRTPSFPPAMAVFLMMMNGLAVWATGSRTAFLAAIIVLVALGAAMAADRGRARGLVMIGAALVALVAVVALAGLANPRIVGPVTRVWATLPALSAASVREFAVEMWNRNGYGAAATAIFREVPLFGIGVGAYHTLAGTFLPGELLPPDNAQNWLRHQLVELGLVGACAWVLWFVLFARFVLRIRRTDTPDLWATRGALTAFGVISFLGMPGQDVMVTVSFWTFAFWYVTAAGVPASHPVPRWAWAAAATVALVAAAGTAQLAATRLRVPTRSVASTWPYSYGISAPERGLTEEGYRRTRSRAVAVLDAPSRWMSVSVRLDALAPPEGVDVRVWTDGSTLLKGRLQGDAPLTAVVELPAERHRVVLEAEAARASRRRRLLVFGADPQFLMKWEFLERLPAGHPGYVWPSSS